jgi:hypothetical protein
VWLVAALLAVATTGLSRPAAAKKLCLETTAPEGAGNPYVYVLEKVKLKSGAYGPVHGYLVRADGDQAFALSGSYAVYGDAAEFTVLLGAYFGAYGYTYRVHQFGIGVDGSGGQDYNRTIATDLETETVGDTTTVDCKTAPDLPQP